MYRIINVVYDKWPAIEITDLNKKNIQYNV